MKTRITPRNLSPILHCRPTASRHKRIALARTAFLLGIACAAASCGEALTDDATTEVDVETRGISLAGPSAPERFRAPGVAIVGDVDGDGDFDVSDLRTVEGLVKAGSSSRAVRAMLDAGEPRCWRLADIDEDGALTQNDLALLQLFRDEAVQVAAETEDRTCIRQAPVETRLNALAGETMPIRVVAGTGVEWSTRSESVKIRADQTELGLFHIQVPDVVQDQDIVLSLTRSESPDALLIPISVFADDIDVARTESGIGRIAGWSESHNKIADYPFRFRAQQCPVVDTRCAALVVDFWSRGNHSLDAQKGQEVDALITSLEAEQCSVHHLRGALQQVGPKPKLGFATLQVLGQPVHQVSGSLVSQLHRRLDRWKTARRAANQNLVDAVVMLAEAAQKDASQPRVEIDAQPIVRGFEAHAKVGFSDIQGHFFVPNQAVVSGPAVALQRPGCS
jgi:hypothetical protein